MQNNAGKIVTRGVFIDLAEDRGVDTLDPGYAITADDLDEYFAAKNLEIRSGDALLVRTGFMGVRRGNWADYTGGPSPGLSLRAASWIRDNDIAAIATDTWGIEVLPNEIDCWQPVHVVSLARAGLAFDEMFNLDALSDDSRADASRSPVSALAIKRTDPYYTTTRLGVSTMVDALSEVRNGLRIEWDVQIPVEGGYLAADVFRPEDNDQHPVLLAASPYAKGLPFSQGYRHQWTSLVGDHPEVMNGSSGAYQVWEYPDPERWVPHGYVCVRVDTRGTGASPGDVDFFSPQETRDLYTCVEWAGTRPWSSGKVGMLGISYLACNQWQVAALRPPHLAAICPWEGASDYYREFTHHGGIVSEFMPYWAPNQVATVQHGRADAPVNPNNGRRVTGPDTIDTAERSKKLIAIGDVLDAHRLCDEYYRDRSAELADITVPVLSASNWGGMGLHSRGNFEAFTRVSSERKWLEVHGLEHWTEFYTDYGLDVQRRFFDHFLKGVDNGWDRTARVQLNLRTPDGFVRRDENEWPLARTDWTRLYLDLADGGLVQTAPSGASGASFKARREVLMFRTKPLPKPLEITGPAALKLFASSTTDEADLFVTVHLFDPRGDEVLFTTAFDPKAPLAQGWLRMSHRAVDPFRSLPYRPWHPHDRVELLEPRHTYEADVEIWPTSIIAPGGYSLGVSVRGVDYAHTRAGNHRIAYGRELLGSGPYWHEHPGDRDSPAFDGTTTLASEPGRRPYLLLPIIPPLP